MDLLLFNVDGTRKKRKTLIDRKENGGEGEKNMAKLKKRQKEKKSVDHDAGYSVFYCFFFSSMSVDLFYFNHRIDNTHKPEAGEKTDCTCE